MPCYRPVHGFQNRPGDKLVFSKAQAVGSRVAALQVPCNNCVGCRLERARQWAMRCNDERSLYSDNCFITLSINPESLKAHGDSLDHRYFQRFMKRLRKSTGGKMIRFFMCGEYGSENARPHYHALLFNHAFKDRVPLKVTDSGQMIYRSPALEKLWSDPKTGASYGFSSVGDVTFGSASYVARYHLKKTGSVVSRNHYLNPFTGEMLKPEYVCMSRGSKKRGTGGIARAWFDKWKSDVYPRDVRVINGVDTLPCKFYDLLYEKVDPDGYDRIKLRRAFRGQRNKLDNTEDRLMAKEKVKLAQISVLKTSKEI